MGKQTATRRAPPLQIAAFAVVSWGLLTSSFADNAFGVVNQLAYQEFQRDSEGLVVGRMVQARASGLWSEGGLTGLRGGAAGNGPAAQYRMYSDGTTGEGFEPYRSHPGANGWVAAGVDGLLPPREGGYINAMRAAMAGLVATLFSGASVAVWRRFGLIAALALVIGTLVSPWVTLFAPNVWWTLWAMYLPMAGAAWCVARRPSLRTAVCIAVLAMGLKVAFTGYEYVTAVLVSGVVPFVYAWASGQRSARYTAAFSAGMVAAGAVGLLVLVTQNAVQSGTWTTGLQHVVTVLGNRTHGDPATHDAVYRVALSASVWDAARPYVVHRGPFAYGGAAWWSFGTWCAVVAAVAAGALLLARNDSRRGPALRGLAAATGAAFLAPLSWFILFKGHNYIHVHMNAIVWYLPFVPMSLVLSGCTLQSALGRLRGIQ